MLRTNNELDENISKESMELTKMKTKKDVINFAISELVKKLKRKECLNLKASRLGW